MQVDSPAWTLVVVMPRDSRTRIAFIGQGSTYLASPGLARPLSESAGRLGSARLAPPTPPSYSSEALRRAPKSSDRLTGPGPPLAAESRWPPRLDREAGLAILAADEDGVALREREGSVGWESAIEGRARVRRAGRGLGRLAECGAGKG